MSRVTAGGGTDMISLGVDVGGTFVRAVLLEPGVATFLGRVRTPEDAADLEPILRSLRRAVVRRPNSVGLGLAASVDPSGRIDRWPNRPAWRGLRIHELVERVFSVVPISLDDCEAAVTAEHVAATFEGHRQRTTTLYVGVGTGVGAGAVIEDRLYRGSRRAVLDLGHVAVASAADTPCRCGRRGCLQSVASGLVLDRAAVAAGLPPDKVAVAVRRGDDCARRLLAPLLEPLGEGIEMALRIVDPDRVVVGGGLAEAGEPFLDGLRQRLTGVGFTQPIYRSHYVEMSGAIGAALSATLNGRDGLYQQAALRDLRIAGAASDDW